MWTEQDTARYRAEVERRFAARTPPTRPDEVLWESRVMRSEMRNWAQQNLGKLPPENDDQWLTQHGSWYQAMAKKHDPAAVKKRRAMDSVMKYTDAQHREEAKKLVRRFNDFDDLYDEAKSDIRPMMDEKEWDHFLDILGKEWKTSAKDSVSPVPIAGKHANGCPTCHANHDPGIPCRNAQPRTGLTKPQLIKRDGKLLGVNMVPVGDAKKPQKPLEYVKKPQGCPAGYECPECGAKQPVGNTACWRCTAKFSPAYDRKKATDSIALSRGDALRDVLMLLSVIKTTR